MVKDLVRLARPLDWTKNVFVLPALIYSGEWRSTIGPGQWEPNWTAILGTLGAFIAFSLLASAIYAVNDTLDRDKDRLHPVKCRRPVASGVISPSTATTFALLLAVAAFGLSSQINPPYLTAALLMYVLLQVAYNLGLKRIMLLDVMAISTGFVLRALAGGAAVPTRVSLWLILCVFFLCLYLGFVKRMCDLQSATKQGETQWRSPAGYDHEEDISWLLGFTGVLSIVMYVMYALSSHTTRLFGYSATAFVLMVPIPIMVMHRMYMCAKRGESDSPLGSLRQDPVVMIGGILFLLGTVTIIYAPGVDDLIRKFFLME
ncbi:MAG: UbiA prenyltransferase family protein [Phycisphaerales bacterium]|nr:UbiA prenyltransferase family protein [Phycisphaerales bacterium]